MSHPSSIIFSRGLLINIVPFQAKCSQYWPSIGEERYGDVKVSLVSTDKTAHYLIRTMDIRHVSEFLPSISTWI